MLARFDSEGKFESVFKPKPIEISENANNFFDKTKTWDLSVLKTKQEFENLSKAIGVTDDSLKKFLTTEDEAYKTKDLATYTKYLNDHNKTLDLATLKTKAWAFAKNMAVNAAIGLAMYGVNLLIKQFDKWIVTTEESREALANLKSECQTIESDLKATNDELEVTRQRMDELEGKGTLTFTEKEEYDNLVKQNNELQRTIDLLKLEQKEKNKEKNKTFVETMEKDVEQHGEYHVSDYGGKVKKGHGGRDIGMNTDEKAYINQQFKDYQDNLAKMAELDAQYKDDLGNKQYQKDRKRLEDQNKKISEYLRGKNTEFTTDADGIEYIENPSNDDEEKVNKWLDFINDFQDKMAIAMGGDNAETNAFNRVVDNWQFDEVVQGLQDLGKEGKVTADMLNDPKYDEFIQKLVYLGIIDSADNLDEIALAFNNVGTEAENSDEKVNKMTDSLEGVTKTLSTLQDKYDELKSAQEEYNSTGAISAETMQKLIDNDLLQYLDYSSGKLRINTDALLAEGEAVKVNAIQKLQDAMATDLMLLAEGKLTEASPMAQTAVENLGIEIEDAGNKAQTSAGLLAGWAVAAQAAKEGAEGKLKDGFSVEDFNTQADAIISAYTNAAHQIGAITIKSPTSSSNSKSSSSDAEEAKKAEEERIKKENEAFKAGLETRQKLLERYKESIDSIDFGLDLAEENDFALRADLLNNKMSQITAYGEAMRQEFDRVASIIPQTGEEAEALASHLESLGSDMRDNIKNLRETQIAMEQLKIDSIASIGDYYLSDLESELSNIEKRIELLNKDNKRDYKQTNRILQMEMFLPTRSNFGDRLKNRSSADREVIDSEQATQDAINDIIEDQIEKNENLREEERQEILAGMEELRNNTQIKIDEAQEYYSNSLKTNEENTKTAWQNMTNTVDTAISNTTEKFSKFDDVVDGLNTKAKTLYDNLSKISKITNGATDGANNSTNDKGGVGFPNGEGGGASDALQEYQDNIEEWIDKHNYEFYDGEVSGHGYSDPFKPGYPITSRVGGRNSPVGKGNEFHTGLDIGATLGTKIYSTSGGTVTLSGVNGGYGNCVVIRDDKGYTWLYGHMAEPSKLKVGDKVRRGQMVGLVGSTGWSTGPHLHLEMRDPNNAVVNPSPYLPNYAKGTPRGNVQSRRLGIAGENFKPELLIDKLTGKISYIDKPTVIDLSKTDVVGERATANLPKFADGTISPAEIASYIRQNYPEITDAGIAALLGNIEVESGFNSKASVNEIIGGGNNNLTTRSGLFQANDDRITGWNDIVSNGTWQQQIDAALEEAKSGSGIGYNAYKNILTNTGLSASDAAKLWDEKWERSDGSARNLRATNAEKYFSQIQDNTLALENNTDALKEPTLAEEIQSTVSGVAGEIDKAVSSTRVQQVEIMNDDNLSDREKTLKLLGIYEPASDKAAEIGADAWEKLYDEFMDWWQKTETKEEQWSQETFDAYIEGLNNIKESVMDVEETASSLKDLIVGYMEDDLAELDQYIEDRNFFGDWKLFGDSETNAIQRQIDTIVEAYNAGALSPEEYNKMIKQYEQSLYTSMKTTLVDSLDLAISKIGSMKTLLQSHFDVTNSITTAQYELNKELSASKTMYEYLNEDTRKLLFNQEDYNVLSEELLDIQDRANDLQEDYNREIRGATSENLDEITSKYQMQYDLLMKSYEIKKADLEILKKQQKLNNVLNERNVRMFINGQWRWVAKTQDVIDAQNELADAKFAQEQASQSALQTEKLNNLTKAEDTLTTTINNVENGIVDFDNQVGEISKVLKGIETTELPGLKNIIGSAVISLSDFVKGIQMAKIDTAISYSKNLDYATLLTNSAYTDSGKEYINQEKRNPKAAGEGLSYETFDDIDGSHHDPIANEYKKNDYWSDVQNSIAKGDYAGAIEANNKRNEKIDYLGLGVEKYSDDDIKDMVYVAHKLAKGGYAKGTGSATPGFSQMGEKGDELFINSHGHLIPINRPTFTNMHGGEIVFNQDQMNFARNLWEWSNTGITDFGGLINKSLPQTIDNSNCNNVIINGMTVDSGSADGQALISALRRYVSTH